MSDSNFISKSTNSNYYFGCTSLTNWKKLITLNNKLDCIPDKYKLLFGKKITRQVTKKVPLTKYRKYNKTVVT